jgi:hypothetical protein
LEKILKFIKECLNSKYYICIKSDYSFRKIAYFKTTQGKEIYLHIDEISTNVYNINFYYYKNNEKIISLTKEGEEFQIIGNIKNAVSDFINNTSDIEFIGYSSFDDERHDLYGMFLKHISNNNFISYWKKLNDMTYYFSYKSDLSPMEKDIYENKFIKYDGKNKKYPTDNII